MESLESLAESDCESLPDSSDGAAAGKGMPAAMLRFPVQARVTDRVTVRVRSIPLNGYRRSLQIRLFSLPAAGRKKS